jgi:hypothetical protein
MSEPTYNPASVKKTAQDIVFIQKAAAGLLKAHAKDGKLPEGMDEETMNDIAVIADMEVLPAKTAAMGALTGIVPGEALYVMWARARNALQLLGTIALMRLADKMDDATAPGETKVLLKVVEWAGLPTPQMEPTTDADRLGKMTQADIGNMTDEDPHAKLMAALKKG